MGPHAQWAKQSKLVIIDFVNADSGFPGKLLRRTGAGNKRKELQTGEVTSFTPAAFLFRHHHGRKK
jgi:hypothetical protein